MVGVSESEPFDDDVAPSVLESGTVAPSCSARRTALDKLVTANVSAVVATAVKADDPGNAPKRRTFAPDFV